MLRQLSAAAATAATCPMRGRGRCQRRSMSKTSSVSIAFLAASVDVFCQLNGDAHNIQLCVSMCVCELRVCVLYNVTVQLTITITCKKYNNKQRIALLAENAITHVPNLFYTLWMGVMCLYQ